MSCCGKKRELQRRESVGNRRQAPVRTDRPRATVLFEYTGSSQLTLRGLITGREYAFEKPGSMVEVDYRDRTMLEAVPSLRML